MKTCLASSLVIAAFLATGCAQEIEQEEVTAAVDLVAEKAAAKAVLDLFPQAMIDEDLELMGLIIAQDPNTMVIGTDAAERWVGYEAFRASLEIQFASYEDSEIVVRDQVITVSRSGEVAWFSELMDWRLTAGGEQVALEGLRMSGVLEKRDGAWVMVQAHASVPVAGQAMEY
ncbi:MAG: nuclear transport factor 2 family protein [Gemmatimonadota bacterium]